MVHVGGSSMHHARRVFPEKQTNWLRFYYFYQANFVSHFDLISPHYVTVLTNGMGRLSLVVHAFWYESNFVCLCRGLFGATVLPTVSVLALESQQLTSCTW